MKINDFNDVMKKCFGDRLINIPAKTMDHSKIDNIEIDGINTKDYPDFVDAYISGADYDGKPMTDEQLDEINNDGDFKYNAVIESMQ